MNDRIRSLLDQIHALEDELVGALHEQEVRFDYRVEGARVEFEHAARQAHLRLRTSVARWIGTSQPRNALSAPFIYAMIAPFAVLDLCLTVYQAICFRLYRIPRVRRSDYIVVDRHHLAYLNSMEKLNCAYCGYANGLIAYAREIAARTEQYWCPIKHARKVLGSHARYATFLPFGRAENYPEHLEQYREALRTNRRPDID